MSRSYNPYTEQAQARGKLEAMMKGLDEERAKIQEEYSAKWTDEKRRQAVQSGDALPGGKFPIKDQEDLKSAVGLVGNSTLPRATVVAHIKKQAKKHGLTLPSSWSSSSS